MKSSGVQQATPRGQRPSGPQAIPALSMSCRRTSFPSTVFSATRKRPLPPLSPLPELANGPLLGGIRAVGNVRALVFDKEQTPVLQ